MTDIHYLVFSAVLTWIMIMTAGELHTPSWTRAGARLVFGNRELLPERSPVAARADHAAKDMVDNMVLFIALVVAARAAGADATTGSSLPSASSLARRSLVARRLPLRLVESTAPTVTTPQNGGDVIVVGGEIQLSLSSHWLAERGWNTHEVFRAAAADPEPTIAAWARGHLPPSDGAFR